jgi:hypothetical protein
MDTRGQATGRGGWRRRPKGPGMCVAELDFAALTPWQRQVVYCTLARHAGVDPGQRPFGVLSLGDRRVLYAVPGLVDRLAEARGITTTVVSPPRYAQWEGQHLMVCTVRAVDAAGRAETSTGAVRWRLWGPGGVAWACLSRPDAVRLISRLRASAPAACTSQPAASRGCRLRVSVEASSPMRRASSPGATGP